LILRRFYDIILFNLTAFYRRLFFSNIFISNQQTKGLNMTRVLQIRRGTSAQNDNFTGLNGEITFDTTNKTLRVHDGATQGGTILARHDEISTFDINSVASTFWTNLFATYQTNKNIQSESSSLITVANSVFIDYEFIYSQIPPICDVALICQTAEGGYSIGDEVRAFGIGDYAYPRPDLYISNGHLHAKLFVDEKAFWVFHKTDATRVNITNFNWKIKFTVYY